MEELIVSFISKWPIVSSILLVMGGLRVVFKPLTGVIQKYVAYTPSLKDDVWFEKIAGSKIYKAVAWVLDFSASIKLPKKK